MLLKKGKGKRIMCAILACALVLVPMTPASAATARATTMKLEKKEGTVTLKTQSGTTRRITNGMRLYNGNSLTTGKKSYAYVSLDSAKAVKLDQSSSATLRQNGKNLELLVKSGKLFFNVSKPLTKKENMNVRTSTMVTGIRGTCGVVEPVTQTQSKLYLIEGKVTMGTGEHAVTVKGGQTATVTLDAGSEQAVQVEKLTESDIPPVALQEIVNDIALQKKIEQTTDLDIAKIKAAFEQWQKEENGQDQTDDRKDDTKTDTKDDEKKDDDQSGSSSDSSSGSSSSPSVPDTAQKENVLTGTVTSGAILAAFEAHDEVGLGAGSQLVLDDKGSLEIPAGKTLSVLGECKVPSGDTTSQQTITVAGKAVLHIRSGACLNCENIQLNAGGSLRVDGTLNGRSLISAGGAAIDNKGEITLSQSYTSAGSDTYQSAADAVLISQEASAAMPSGSLLMNACSVRWDSNSQQWSTGGDAAYGYYYYADGLCQNVIKNMGVWCPNVYNEICVQWNFQKNVTLSKNDHITLTDFLAQMNDKTFLVEGTLTLKGRSDIIGAGDATVKINGGSLLLPEGSSISDNPRIRNTGTGYAIACDGSGLFSWKNKYAELWVKNAGFSLQGISYNAENRIVVPNYVTLADDGALDWNENYGYLRYAPFDFENPGETVTKDKIDYSLGLNQTMIIGANVYGELKSGETVTIPAGKTLRICSKILDGKTGSSGFQIATGSAIEIGENATLLIEGDLWGEGMIKISGKGKLVVADGATVAVQKIEKADGAVIDNKGTIKTPEGLGDTATATAHRRWIQPVY